MLASSRGEHLTAADVLERTNSETGPSVDQSTVYRTLETLEISGLIQHTHMGHGPLVYHLSDEQPHQHLICMRCGTTVAVPESELGAFFDQLTAITGFVPDPTHVALSGLCGTCSTEAAG